MSDRVTVFHQAGVGFFGEEWAECPDCQGTGGDNDGFDCEECNGTGGDWIEVEKVRA